MNLKAFTLTILIQVINQTWDSCQ